MENVTGTAGQEGPRRLVRTPDGKIGGVAAGIAHYLGLDPTIVRIAFIVLAFAGGIGVLLYVVSWIVMPKGDVEGARPATPLDTWAIVGVVGLIVGVGMLVGWHGIGDGERAIVAAALVVGGVLLIGRKNGPWSSDDGGTTATPPAPPDPEGSGGVDLPIAETDTAVTLTDTTHLTEPAPPAPGTEPTVSGARGALTGVVLSLLAIGIGLCVAADASGWVEIGPATVVACGLVVVGVGLVVAAFFGGAPTLIVFGALLSVALVPAVVIDTVVEDGVGEQNVIVAPRGLEAEYRLGVGDLNLDLSRVELNGGTRVVEVSVEIGSAVVWLPPRADVVVRGHVDAGRLEGPGGQEVDGFHRDLDVVDNAVASTGRLVIDLDIGIGEGEVLRG